MNQHSDHIADPTATPAILDAVSYLSGVNFGSVCKVLAAIDALRKFQMEISVDDILKSRHAPDCPLDPSSPAHYERADNSRRLVINLINAGYANDYFLQKVRYRFGAPTVI
jgi:hypothetical protein